MKNINKIIINLIIIATLFFSNIAIGSNTLFEDIENKNIHETTIKGNNNDLIKSNIQKIIELSATPINIDKKIIYGRNDEKESFLIDSINAEIGEIINFQISITYEPIAICGFVATNINIVDKLPSCLLYDQTSSIIEYDGQKYFGDTGFSNNNIYWNITEIFNIFLWEQFTIYFYGSNLHGITLFYLLIPLLFIIMLL